VANVARLAAIQGALADLLDRAADDALTGGALPPHQLALATLAAVQPGERPWVLRRWLVRAGVPAPGHRQLAQIEHEVAGARDGAVPLARWREHAVRRHAGRLYLTPARLPAPPPVPLAWQPDVPLRLPWGTLAGAPAGAGSLAAARLAGARVTVDFRRGGERCRPAGRAHGQSLKKLFQEWQVPPWERSLTPLVRVDGEVAAVVGHCVCAGFTAAAGEPGLDLAWRWQLYPEPASGSVGGPAGGAA
jgi:tRNA(Ile)-lysidine synthase